MDIIEQNPYRVLGVLSNSSKKEIVANFGKIKAFSKTGKTVSFENDFSTILKPVIRTEESSAKAYNDITLPKDKLSAGLFWFIQSTQFDEIAMNHLRKGNIDSAVSILRKKPTVSSCVNLAVLNLIRKNWTTALYYYVYLLNDGAKRTELLSIIVDNPELFSETEVIQVFVDKLTQSFPAISWMESLNQKEVLLCDKLFEINDFFQKSNVYDSFVKKICESDKKRIDNALSKAASAEGNNAKQNLKAAKTLEEDAKLLLRSIRLCLGKDNKDYQSYCDKVANQILDNCIDYYNHDKNNPLRSRNIIQLLRFASRTAEGKIAKERCKQNYDHIKKECDALIPEEIEGDVNYIKKQIEEFKKLNSVSNYAGYLNATLYSFYQKLESIKANVGSDSPHYINLSSFVVHFGIDVIIDEVNAKMKEYNDAPNLNDAKELMELRKTLKWGKPILETLKSFTKNKVCLDRYNNNLKNFDSLYEKYHVDALDNTNIQSYTLAVNAPLSVNVGDQFRIQFTVNCKENIGFSGPTFNGLELLYGPTTATTQTSTIYSYVLKAHNPGTYVITSATAKIGKSIISSQIKTLKVNGIAKPQSYTSTKPQNQDNHSTSRSTAVPSSPKKKDSFIGWIFGILLVLIVVVITINQCGNAQKTAKVTGTVSSSTPTSSESAVSNSSSYSTTVSSTENTYVEDSSPAPEPTYSVVYYNTGDRPYQSFYGRGRYDSETQNSLLIKNGSTSDAVVFLETLGGKKVRHVYVCKGETFKMTQIPGGKYITKIFQGNTWNPDKYNGDSTPSGGFMEDISMSKSESYDPFDYPYPSSGHYYDYEITLYKVTNGNMHTENINAQEMF